MSRIMNTNWWSVMVLFFGLPLMLAGDDLPVSDTGGVVLVAFVDDGEANVSAGGDVAGDFARGGAAGASAGGGSTGLPTMCGMAWDIGAALTVKHASAGNVIGGPRYVLYGPLLVL